MKMTSEIDEDLYSRQLYVLGKEAMEHMSTTRVLICGLSGLGIEIAKNIVLSGVQTVTLFDPTPTTISDLGSQFFLQSSDITKRRDIACHPRLAELNNYVIVNVAEGFEELSEDLLDGHTVVVLLEYRIEELLRVNGYCHDNGIKFVAANSCGLAGQIFCDFGDKHVVRNANGLEPSTAKVQYITKEKGGIVRCYEETPHNLGEEELITFTDVNGMVELNNCEPIPVEVINIHTLRIGDTSAMSDYTGGGTLLQVKSPVIHSYKRISEAMRCPRLMHGCGDVMSRPVNLHLCFRALPVFTSQTGREFPRPWCAEDADRFVECVKQIFGECSIIDYKDLDPEAWRVFANTCGGDIPPFKSVIGGFTAQEVIKACSGQFRPLKQWFYMDCWKCLAETTPTPEDVPDIPESRHHGQMAVFGKSFQEKLANQRYFVAGAGAIGCELLKNFALMGLATGSQGQIYVTDMDTIEKSNLNRQFLFRPWDIQKSKSKVAADAIKSINSDIKIEAHENRLGPESEATYNDEFFLSLDGVTTALDNVESRRYLSERCIFYSKPFLDSGTLGTQGSVQLVLPQIKTVYRSGGNDDKHIPVCTLKNFPYEIHHTIQWARDLFAGLFANPSATGAAYMQNRETFLARLRSQGPREAQQPLEQLSDLLITNRPNTFADCVNWARQIWQQNFSNQIRQILFNFPVDKKTSSGVPFWSGVKHSPVPLEFDAKVALHLDFIMAAANLRAAIFSIPCNRDRAELERLATAVMVDSFDPDSNVKIAETDEEDKMISVNTLSARRVNELCDSLSSLENLSSVHLEAIEFEKDDDSNFHIDFITAASNLRAENYYIPPVDRLKTKLIAGRIMPAVSTTTSLVAGLICLEMYKLVHGHHRNDQFYNNFCNLASPLFAFVTPISPPEKEYNGKTFSAWDFFEVQGEMTLAKFLKHFEIEHQLKVVMVSQGKNVLYASYMPTVQLESRMKLNMSALSELITKNTISSAVKAIPLQLLCEGENIDDEPFDVPVVKYFLNR